ncbi:hypothetical protein ACLQ2S_00185 [Micromonospora sp. DT48]|uniref:hypothetical protein n=1 Tax=unclassified Micromonospora TaxID=2617518 RepID=UPI0012BBE3E5|nr:hypothetical protein [Micromonospora sp. CP22]MTK00979.1 hypothetical protein [Micromonospora sp. CP22]
MKAAFNNYRSPLRFIAALLTALAITFSGSPATAGPAAGPDRIPPLIAQRAKLVESSAAAGSIGTLGCQSTSAMFQIDFANGWSQGITCSGTHDIYQQAVRFKAGGWSGIVYYGTSSTWAFCDWENWDFPYYARYVVLYPTKASWC